MISFFNRLLVPPLPPDQQLSDSLSHQLGIGHCIPARPFRCRVAHRQNGLRPRRENSIHQLPLTRHRHNSFDSRLPRLMQCLSPAPDHTPAHSRHLAHPRQLPHTALPATSAFIQTVNHILRASLLMQAMRQQQQDFFRPHLDPTPPNPPVIHRYYGFPYFHTSSFILHTFPPTPRSRHCHAHQHSI